MFADHPLSGVGLGEFFPWYLRLKPVDAEVTRDPHNILLSFLSQAGVLGGLAVVLLFLLPWVAATFMERRRGGAALYAASIGAVAAWMTHSMFQFNELIPGTLYFAAAGGLFFMDGGFRTRGVEAPLHRRVALFASALACALFACHGFSRVPGERLMRMGEVEEAREKGAGRDCYASAARKLEQAVMPWRELGDSLARAGQWKEAHDAFVEMAARIPHRASAHFRLACSSMALGRLDDAEIALDKAEQWYPFYPELFIARAVLADMRARGDMSFMARDSIARQVASVTAQCRSDGEGLLVTFDAKNHGLLEPVLAGAALRTADGRPVSFKAAE